MLPLALITAVLGPIFAGFASPTEAASLGCVGAVSLAVWNRRFNLNILKEVSRTTTRQVINLQTSFMTAPFRVSLFYLKAVTPP